VLCEEIVAEGVTEFGAFTKSISTA